MQKNANNLLEFRVKERTVELEVANKQLLELSNKDTLTGLNNKGFFNDFFNKTLKNAKRNNSDVSLLIIDIDFFKRVNDTYGHLTGDDCLKSVANLLRNTVSRPLDLVSRFGGEEFVIVLPETPSEGANLVAEKIRKRIEEHSFCCSEQKLKLTVSIGIASLSSNRAMSCSEVFSLADSALYQAKNSGRNRSVLSEYSA